MSLTTLSSLLSWLEIQSRVSTNEHYKRVNQESNSSENYTQTFVTQLLHQAFDEDMIEFIQDTKHGDELCDASVDKMERIQTYVNKLLNHFYDKYNEVLRRLSYLFHGTEKSKDEIVSEMTRILNLFSLISVDDEKTSSGLYIYDQFISHLAGNVAEIVDHDRNYPGPTRVDPVEIITDICKSINKTMDYESEIYSRKRKIDEYCDQSTTNRNLPPKYCNQSKTKRNKNRK